MIALRNIDKQSWWDIVYSYIHQILVFSKFPKNPLYTLKKLSLNPFLKLILMEDQIARKNGRPKLITKLSSPISLSSIILIVN